MKLKNLLYLLQLEEYDLKRFDDWLKRNPGQIVVEKKNHINWTLKARVIFMLAKIFGIKTAVYILSPIDFLFKKILVYRATAKIKKMTDLTVIGVTGSFGKTTTKDAISHVLIHEYKILKTEGNYNTLLGIAKTIVNDLKPEHKIFVCEMAAYQPGDIKEIAGLVKPKIGIVTAIGPMHFERFGSMENILKTKLGLIESLPDGGTGFLPKELESQASKYFHNWNYGSKSKIEFFSSKEELMIKIGEIFGLEKDDVLGRVKTVPPTPHRQEIIKTAGNITIIDDSYNSNPAGFASALETLKNIDAERRILVTPGMIELGEKQFELNKNAAIAAAQIADFVIIVGETNKFALEKGLQEEFHPTGDHPKGEKNDFEKRVFWAPDLDSAKKKLSEITLPNSAILLENDLPDHYF